MSHPFQPELSSKPQCECAPIVYDCQPELEGGPTNDCPHCDQIGAHTHIIDRKGFIHDQREAVASEPKPILQKLRQKFEQWATDIPSAIARNHGIYDVTWTGTHYLQPRTQDAFHGWQAASERWALDWIKVERAEPSSHPVEVETRREGKLRELLWIRHGCTGLYGDDGELQCGRCGIDFKRDPVESIEARFRKINLAKIAAHRADSPPSPDTSQAKPCKTCKGVGSYYPTPDDRSTRCIECPICHGTGVEPASQAKGRICGNCGLPLAPTETEEQCREIFGEGERFMSAEEFWKTLHPNMTPMRQYMEFAEAYAQARERARDERVK